MLGGRRLQQHSRDKQLSTYSREQNAQKKQTKKARNMTTSRTLNQGRFGAKTKSDSTKQIDTELQGTKNKQKTIIETRKLDPIVQLTVRIYNRASKFRFPISLFSL